MTVNMKTVQATCLCGAASHTITLPSTDFPLRSWWCSCTSCRRMTGTLALCCVNMLPSYSPPTDLVAKLGVYDFTKRVKQYFCETCGCQMLARCLDDAEAEEPKVTWDVMSGTLDKFDGVAYLQGHEFVGDTLDGGISDFIHEVNGKELDRWSANPDKSPQLSRHWRDDRIQTVEPFPSDKIHAYCKCKGVEFWINRPSARSTHAESSWPDLLRPNAPENPENETWWLRANNKKFLAGFCSCNSCRLVSGMETVQWAFVPTVDMKLDATGEVKFERQFGTLKKYKSSKGVSRHFCGTCGAMVFYECDDRPFLFDVAVGLLDAEEGARAENLLDWGTKRFSYREDAIDRAGSLVVAIEKGLEEYGKKRGTPTGKIGEGEKGVEMVVR